MAAAVALSSSEYFSKDMFNDVAPLVDWLGEVNPSTEAIAKKAAATLSFMVSSNDN